MKPSTLFRVVTCAAALLAFVSTCPAVSQESCGEGEGFCRYYPPDSEGWECVPCVTHTFDETHQTNRFDFGTGHAIKFTTHVLQPFDLTVLFVPIDDQTLFNRLNDGLGPADCIPYDGATSNASLGTCGFYHVDNPPEKGVDYSGNVTATVWWDFPTLDQLNNVRLYRAPLDGSDNSCLQGFDCYTQDITNAVYAFGDSSNPDPGVRGTATGFSDFEAVDLTSPTSAAARVWIGLKNSGDAGIRFDLKAIVKKIKKNCPPSLVLVSSGELLGADGGTDGGFNNATLRTIPLSLPAGAFASRDIIIFELFVRNSCVGSNKNSGTARLWFNDAAANSRVDEPGTPTRYLRPLFFLDGPGSGPRIPRDVFVRGPDPSCNGPWVPFGIWAGLVP